MSAATPGTKPYYYVPHPSHWPITGACALFLLALGATCWVNSISYWPWLVGAGFLVLLVMLFGWFGTVIGTAVVLYLVVAIGRNVIGRK